MLYDGSVLPQCPWDIICIPSPRGASFYGLGCEPVSEDYWIKFIELVPAFGLTTRGTDLAEALFFCARTASPSYRFCWMGSR